MKLWERFRGSCWVGGLVGAVIGCFIVAAIVCPLVLFMGGCDIDDEVAELLAAHGRKGDSFIRPDGQP